MITFPATPLTDTRLRGQAYLASRDFRYFLGTSWLPILINELASLLGQYVVAFREVEGRFTPVVLTDIGFHRNVYISRKGAWQCRYLPVCLQTYPFILQPSDTGRPVLGVADERLVSEGQDGATPLFDAEGRLSDDVQKHHANLEAQQKAYQSTLDRTQILSDEGLIVDWPLRVRFLEGENPALIEGLYRIDPDRLLNMGGDKLEYLKKYGVLTFALSQPMSMQHVSILMDRVAYLVRQEAPPKTAGGVGSGSVVSETRKPSFSLSDDDIIDF